MRDAKVPDRAAEPGAHARRLWALIGLLALAAAAAAAVTGVGVRPVQTLGIVLFTAAMLAVAAIYTWPRPDERLSRLFRAAAEFVLITFLAGMLSYIGASFGRPFWDETLHAWDRVLGFDWMAWLAVLDGLPAFNIVLVLAYHSMLPQFVLLIVALVTIRAYRALDLMLMAYAMAAALTVAFASAMPALSPVIHLDITLDMHPNISLAVGREFAEHAQALRAGTLKIIDLNGAQGLVTFPSFHTVGTILLALGFWNVPWLRWPALALNLLMLMSIPINGSHYLVDVIAGAGVAVLCHAAAQAACSDHPRQRVVLPAPAE
jgi:hypothetical protein